MCLFLQETQCQGFCFSLAILIVPFFFAFSFSKQNIKKLSIPHLFCLQGTLLLDRYPVEVLARCTDMNATGKWKKDYNCHHISRSAIWMGPAFLCRPKSAQVSLHQGSRPDRFIMQTATWNPNSAQTQPSFILEFYCCIFSCPVTLLSDVNFWTAWLMTSIWELQGGLKNDFLIPLALGKFKSFLGPSLFISFPSIFSPKQHLLSSTFHKFFSLRI